MKSNNAYALKVDFDRLTIGARIGLIYLNEGKDVNEDLLLLECLSNWIWDKEKGEYLLPIKATEYLINLDQEELNYLIEDSFDQSGAILKLKLGNEK